MLNERFHAALAQLPQPLAQQLITAQQHAPEPLSYFDAATVAYWCTHLNLSQTAFAERLLPLAAAFAETPISDFQVGAVALDSDGNAYLGANFEFAGVHIGQTIHAEQSAIAHAWSRGASQLAALAVNYAPCGHCRQFINEANLSSNFRVVLPQQEPQPLTYYLSDAFGPADLGITERILGGQTQSVTESDPLLKLTKLACINSHAPYSRGHCGIALHYADSDTVTGSYAENAAFNPSLPPLQMALNTRRLQGQEWHNIKRAVMVETTAAVSQRENTVTLLAKITANTTLEYLHHA